MYTAPVRIEDNVWIGGNVTICPGITIDENSVVGAGSVVIHDIPANSIAAGNPARINGSESRFPNHFILSVIFYQLLIIISVWII